jgi:hypothetical protein
MSELFLEFPKIPRLRRGCVITEKLDGTNAQILIDENGKLVAVGSRTRLITPGKQTDNYGFAAWCEQNRETLEKLGHGRHYGEWYGLGINRGYGLYERRFALFNSARWVSTENLHSLGVTCCEVVKVLTDGDFTTRLVDECVARLKSEGSLSVPGYMNPEGVVVYLKASGERYKVLCENDELPKGLLTHHEKKVDELLK